LCDFVARRTANPTTAPKSAARNAAANATHQLKEEAGWLTAIAVMPPDKPPTKPPIRPARIYLIFIISAFLCSAKFNALNAA